MIGVAVFPSERAAARELFELFKTPWEYQEPDRTYDVLISSSHSPGSPRATLSLLYGSDMGAFDTARGITPHLQPAGTTLVHAAHRLPLYGPVATFPSSGHPLLKTESAQVPALLAFRDDRQTIIRVGYNLFAEIQFLLTSGQPARHAGTATLENHLAFLRDLITRAGLPLVEIPPVPAGYPFMVCLTHDIDHPLLRNHCWDHTMAGFLYRAALVSPLNFCRGRIPFATVLQNWAAVLRLPFVYLGWTRDPWSTFDRYMEIEAGLGATYFFIPQRDYPGKKADGAAPAKRACRYSLAEVGSQLKRILATGNEVGLHGLDAWRDAQAGRDEQQRLIDATKDLYQSPEKYGLSVGGRTSASAANSLDGRRGGRPSNHAEDLGQDVSKGGEEGGTMTGSFDPFLESPRPNRTGATELGIRMHWLYFDEQSPARLEEAGFSYDSTFGFNETVGYRAGTAQAFRPLGNERLLELPLQVMDTALFYPSYLNLSEPEARRLVGKMLDDVSEVGGALTINWHDRSLFAERLWGDFYFKLIAEMKRRRAWFPTAAQAVAWFRKRRSASLEVRYNSARQIEVEARSGTTNSIPGLTLRFHPPCPRSPDEVLARGPQSIPKDHPFNTEIHLSLPV